VSGSQGAVIAAADAAARAARDGRTPDQLMDELLVAAREKAIAPISGFAVGAVARGRSGALYLGANLELPGHPLNASVHAEQAAVISAWAHGETGIDALAASETPCGHCRQFLNELTSGGALPVLVHGKPPLTLNDLLPSSFGPADLHVTAALMSHQPQHLRLVRPDDERTLAPARLDAEPQDGSASEHQDSRNSGYPQADPTTEALRAAEQAYAPYGKTYAGIALALGDGSIRTGRYAESAAFNPSLSPLQTALSGLALDGIPFSRIRAAALVETAGPVSQRAATEALLATVAPGVVLTYVRAVPA
jgi:cytidine deaminase